MDAGRTAVATIGPTVIRRIARMPDGLMASGGEAATGGAPGRSFSAAAAVATPTTPDFAGLSLEQLP